jgi:amino acid adenylation domain-containing protein
MQNLTHSHRVRPTNPFVIFPRSALERSIPDRFAQQVAMAPDRIAVTTPNHTLTYGALNQEANRIARVLLAQRWDGDGPVALLLDQDAPLITAILGVLKAGKIYMPLELRYPQTRLASMLEEAHAACVVTNTRHLALATTVAPPSCHVLNVDAIDASVSGANLDLTIAPETLASLLYTSGSTGRPKGIVQSHGNLLHKIIACTNDYHLSADDRLSLLYSCSFSGSARDIFGALLNGATLCIYPLKEQGIAGLAAWLRRENVTVYHSVATVFRHLTDTLREGERLDSLRLVQLAGEPVTARDVALYKQYCMPHCLLVTRLSASEAGIIRQYFIDKTTVITGSIVPVGYAVADKEVLLLDETGAEVGPDSIGEIAVRSSYLAPAYWRQEGLTRAAFQPDTAGSNARLYRTGDLGRLLPDGCLLHLGRKDAQVKIRGHRVEVVEVEMVLRDHPAIQEAAVVAQRNGQGDQRLVAYLVAAGPEVPTVSALYRFVQERLPDYMVPSVFVWQDALPLTPTGKVDRGALPAPGSARPPLETPCVPPRTPVEAELAQIWAEVLGLDTVGVHDHFFELGGHSLLATQIVTRVHNILHVEVPLAALMEAPTVAEMAVVVTQHQAEKIEAEDVHRLVSGLEGLSEEEVQQRLPNAYKEEGRPPLASSL